MTNRCPTCGCCGEGIPRVCSNQLCAWFGKRIHSEFSPTAQAPRRAPSRDQFTSQQWCVFVVGFSVTLGAASWVGDFLILPPIVAIALFTLYWTRGTVIVGMLTGGLLGVLLVSGKVGNVPGSVPGEEFFWEPLVYAGVVCAIIGGGLEAILAGYGNIGWPLVIVCGSLILGFLMLTSGLSY